MKKILVIGFTFLICFGLTACGRSGTTENVKVDYDSSEKFSNDEIESAVEAIKIKFKDFKGCSLKNLYYDEEKSNIQVDSYMESGKGSVNGIKKENVIVLFSEFKTDSNGGDGSLNPNFTYTGWNWILIRDSETDSWKVDDWGY